MKAFLTDADPLALCFGGAVLFLFFVFVAENVRFNVSLQVGAPVAVDTGEAP